MVRPAKTFRPEDCGELTTPSVRNKVASHLFFDRTATPPFQGGECYSLTKVAYPLPSAAL